MFLAISLALPIYSMAQTAQTKLTLESYTTGDRIGGANVKTFSLGQDGNLVIYLDGPFTFASLVPDITVDNTQGSYTNSVPTKPATVTATQPTPGTSLLVTFKIFSLTSGTTFTMPVNPEPGVASFGGADGRTFSWNIGGSIPAAVGSYLAVFEGSSGTNKSQLVVMINIVPPGYTLTINAANGSVTKNPDQATYTISPAQTVQLTPVPASGYYFTGWSGDLLGTSHPTTILMDGNKTVTASFAVIQQQTYLLAVYVSGAGSVGKNPDKTSYSSGEQVILTATPNSGATFAGWNGDLTGSTNPATITMDSNKSVTASFTSGQSDNPKLINIAPGSGDFYGLGYDTYAQGQVKTYTLPLGEVYPSKNLQRLRVMTAAMMDGIGDVSIKLISPDGGITYFADGSFADETLNAIAKTYPMGENYPADYLDSGNWTLEITAKQASNIKIWWKCYY